MASEGSGRECVGERVYRLRCEREMTPAELGDPQFTAAFISAVEAGHHAPSDLARTLLAGHLDIPAAALTGLPAPVVDPPDLGALGEDLLCQIEHARRRLYSDPRGFLAALAPLLAPWAGMFPQLPARVRYRVQYLQANAYLRSGDLAAADPALERALALAAELADSGQELERVRNALGALYYLQDQPARALDIHKSCLHAIHTGVVKDLTLTLVIYTSVAHDYWALNDIHQAVGIYHEALARLADVDYPAHQAEILAGLSSGYYALGDLDAAKDYGEQALAVREAIGDPQSIGRLATNLAMVLLARREYERVEGLLARACALLTAPDDEGLRSETYMYYALLELERGALEAAAERAGEAVRLGAAGFAGQDPAAGMRSRAFAARTYARALAVAGQVAERRGEPAAADTCFQQALALLERCEYAETGCEIAQSYAELLNARGDHARAGAYYRLAYTHTVGRS